MTKTSIENSKYIAQSSLSFTNDTEKNVILPDELFDKKFFVNLFKKYSESSGAEAREYNCELGTNSDLWINNHQIYKLNVHVSIGCRGGACSSDKSVYVYVNYSFNAPHEYESFLPAYESHNVSFDYDNFQKLKKEIADHIGADITDAQGTNNIIRLR